MDVIRRGVGWDGCGQVACNTTFAAFRAPAASIFCMPRRFRMGLEVERHMHGEDRDINAAFFKGRIWELRGVLQDLLLISQTLAPARRSI